jgi:hypothetical protein
VPASVDLSYKGFEVSFLTGAAYCSDKLSPTSSALLKALLARRVSVLCRYVTPPLLSLGTTSSSDHDPRFSQALARLAPNRWGWVLASTTPLQQDHISFSATTRRCRIFTPNSMRSSAFAHSNPAHSVYWPSNLDAPPRLAPHPGWTHTRPAPTARVMRHPRSPVSR